MVKTQTLKRIRIKVRVSSAKVAYTLATRTLKMVEEVSKAADEAAAAAKAAVTEAKGDLLRLANELDVELDRERRSDYKTGDEVIPSDSESEPETESSEDDATGQAGAAAVAAAAVADQPAV